MILDTRPHPPGCKCQQCSPLPTLSVDPAILTQAAYDLAVARRARAEDRLRSQRKRHAQRLAAMQAEIGGLRADNRALSSKCHDYAWKLKLAEDPSKTVRSILERAIKIAEDEGKEVPPCT